MSATAQIHLVTKFCQNFTFNTFIISKQTELRRPTQEQIFLSKAPYFKILILN